MLDLVTCACDSQARFVALVIQVEENGLKKREEPKNWIEREKRNGRRGWGRDPSSSLALCVPKRVRPRPLFRLVMAPPFSSPDARAFKSLLEGPTSLWLNCGGGGGG